MGITRARHSPDLNPIEKLFAKLKAMLRKAAKRAVQALWDEVGRLSRPQNATIISTPANMYHLN